MPIKEHYSTKHFKGNYIKYNFQHSHLLVFASFLYNSNSNTNTAHTPQTKSTYLAFQSKHKNTYEKFSIKRSTINLPSAAAEPTPLHGRSHTRKNHHKQTDHTANSDETNSAGPHSSAANQAPPTEHRHQKRPSTPPLIADTMNHQQRHGLSLG